MDGSELLDELNNELDEVRRLRELK